MLRRCLFSITLLLLAAGLSGCSYLTNFVIVNDSGSPIEVRYRIKNYPGSFSPPVAPASLPASDLSAKGTRGWTRLPADRVKLDETNRTVTVQLNPQEALLVANMHDYAGPDDPGDAAEFPIQAINLSGTHGEIHLADDEARTRFTGVSRALYTLTYK